MKKVVRNILLGVLALVVLAIVGLSVFTGKAVFDGVTNSSSREETIKNSEEFAQKFENLKENYYVEELMIENPNSNYDIPAVYVREDGNRNIAVLVHGLGGTKTALPDIMLTFLNLGYDVIAYDQRNSGENLTNYNTMGFLESLDTLTVIDYISDIYDPTIGDSKLILWGESYGSITSIIAASRDDSKIDYLILDSPISDGRIMIENVMKDISESQGIPMGFLMGTGDWYTKYALGFSFKDLDGAKWIQNVSVPVLITNSAEDTLTPPFMAEDLYEAIDHDKKEKVTVKGYKHGQFPMMDPEGYQKIVEEFIRKY